MEQRQAVFLLGEGESKSLQMTVEGNDAGVTCAKSRNRRGGDIAKRMQCIAMLSNVFCNVIAMFRNVVA